MGFALDIQKFADKAGISGTLVARRFALLAIQGVVERSPVKKGRFRASWQIGVGEADTSVAPPRDEHFGPEHGDPITGEELERADAALLRAGWGDTLFASNSLPYAQVLEDGSSAQTENQPDGILGVTVDRLEAHAEDIVRQVARS